MRSQSMVTLDGCHYWMDGRTLLGIHEGDAMTMENAFEVTAPESQEWLDKLGEMLGQRFRFEDFAGR